MKRPNKKISKYFQTKLEKNGGCEKCGNTNCIFNQPVASPLVASRTKDKLFKCHIKLRNTK